MTTNWKSLSAALCLFALSGTHLNAGPIGVTTPETAGLVVFYDACTAQWYAMNPDGTSRQGLPSIGTRVVVDLSRGTTPMTILAGHQTDPTNFSSDQILEAITISGSPGNWTVGTPVQLLQATDPSFRYYARFSPDGGRIAYIHQTYSPGYAREIWIGDVVRDATGNPTLSNITKVADLSTLGLPGDSNTEPGGELDFAPDGYRLVVTFHEDLWELFLGLDGHTLTGVVRLTQTPDFWEQGPRWSPTAGEIAFWGGPTTTCSFGGTCLSFKDMNIYSLNVSTGAVRQVTTSNNSSGAGKQSPGWSPSATTLIYSAEGQAAFGKRGISSCSSLVNFDLFQIRADGSKKAINVTNTAGNGVEGAPRWGW